VHGARSPRLSASSARGAVWGSMMQRSTIDDKVYGTAISTTPATRCYTHTSTATAGEGFSPGQWAAQRRRSTSKWTNSPNSNGDLWAWFLSCTGMPRALEAQRRSLPAMRSDRESSHQRRVGVTHMICDGRWRSGPMMAKPTTKQP
jgi:hypothetical protein